jgi:hypothetical protein
VAHSAASDPNRLLGRPDQYVVKVNWRDTRASDADRDLTIEVFTHEDAMLARARFAARFSEA